MSSIKYVKPVKILLKGHPELRETWVQERIAEDPSLLGLGELTLKDKERVHAGAGRLDLLLQDDANRRYEVEIQLGKTDESHIIRTLEYWDIERKRYPQYEHTAVLVAEDITSRFLNIISLFNGFIPLIAIQMQAIKTGEQTSLIFTTVLSEMRLGLVEEDEDVQPTDRAYWEERSGKSTLAMADQLLEILKLVDSDLALKYNRQYIGLAKNGQPNNFVVLKPKKSWILTEVRLEHSEETQAKLDEAGFDLMEYDSRWRRYRIRLAKDDIKRHEILLKEIFKASYDVSIE